MSSANEYFSARRRSAVPLNEIRLRNAQAQGHPSPRAHHPNLPSSTASQHGIRTPVIPILSTAIGILQVCIYCFAERFGIQSEDDVMVSWQTVVEDGEYWRLLIAHFFHFGRLHVILNGISLFCFGRYLEWKIKWLPLLLILEAMGVLASFLTIAANTFVTGYPTDTGNSGSTFTHFALRILLAYTQEPRNYEPSLFLGFYPAYLSPIWAPWQPLLEVSLLKLIIKEQNFTGHFCGILTGFLVSFFLKIFPSRFIYSEAFLTARQTR